MCMFLQLIMAYKSIREKKNSTHIIIIYGVWREANVLNVSPKLRKHLP